jgi:hypothetical protein
VLAPDQLREAAKRFAGVAKQFVRPGSAGI